MRGGKAARFQCTMAFERQARSKGFQRIAGADEAGERSGAAVRQILELLRGQLERDEIDVAIMGAPPQRMETEAVAFAAAAPHDARARSSASANDARSSIIFMTLLRNSVVQMWSFESV